MHVETIETESLGNRGYLVHDGQVAIAIDVQRDYQRWVEAADKAGVKITHVFETHMHNDYVTGGFQLAKKHGAAYVIPEDSGTKFEALELADDQSVETGSLQITGLHTPGHTEHHMSYAVTDGDSRAVFTGGGILYGTVGRTDLVSKEKTNSLTYAQYDSAQRLGKKLPDTTAVFPTHGFGSFCSSTNGSGASQSTLASEKKSNIAFTNEREEFVRQILSGLGPYPRYYAHMGPANQQGPGEVRQLHIHSYSAQEIGKHLHKENSWVIDTRARKLFAAHHPEGAVGIELGKSFSTYIGWLLPWSDKMMLVGDSQQALLDAYTELSRIGMDQFVNGATDNIANYLSAGEKSSYRISNFSDLKNVIGSEPYVLDVRLASEREDGFVKGSHNIPLHELLDRIGETPKDVDIWVHCASGYRASIAASLLDKMGRRPVVIDDSFDSATDNGITEK